MTGRVFTYEGDFAVSGRGGDVKSWSFFVALTVVVSAVGCFSQPAFQDPFSRPQIDWRPSRELGIGEAERILGNRTRLERVTAYLDQGTRAYQSSFREERVDSAMDKTGGLGYMYEQYPSAEAARSFLNSTLKANHLNPKDAIRTEGGAELHYFTRGDVVRMVMILKESRLVRLKVNPVTSRYSLVEFRKVAEELAKQL
jgi:hypothetical protein